jgi:hypothetical protein
MCLTCDVTTFRKLAENRLLVRGRIFAFPDKFQVEVHVCTIAEDLLVQVEYQYKTLNATHPEFAGNVWYGDATTELEKLLHSWEKSHKSYLRREEVLVLLHSGSDEVARQCKPTEWRFLRALTLANARLYSAFHDLMTKPLKEKTVYLQRQQRDAVMKTINRLGAFISEQDKKMTQALEVLGASVHLV